MKKKISIVIGTTAAVIAIDLTCRSYSKLREDKRRTDSISVLPELPFRYLKTSSQPVRKSVVVNYFYPDCEHCQHMAGETSRHASSFRGTHFVMITGAGPEATIIFLKNHGLDTLPFLSVGLDTANAFPRIFNTSVVPSFFVYNKHLQLQKVIYGETKIETIYEVLE